MFAGCWVCNFPGLAFAEMYVWCNSSNTPRAARPRFANIERCQGRVRKARRRIGHRALSMGFRHNTTYLQAAGLGLIAGMRSMSAPAVLSHRLMINGRNQFTNTLFKTLASPKTAVVLKLLTVGEMVVDKLPVTPARIAPPALIGRVLSGALTGATWAAHQGQRSATGAAYGALAALAASYGTYLLRRTVGQQLQVPDPLVGLVEDLVVLASGVGMLQLHPA
jgi:uncharacterized membrane protein